MAKETSSTSVTVRPETVQHNHDGNSTAFFIVFLVIIIGAYLMCIKKNRNKYKISNILNNIKSSSNKNVKYNTDAIERAKEKLELREQLDNTIEIYYKKIEEYNDKIKEWNAYLADTKPYVKLFKDIASSMQPFAAFAYYYDVKECNHIWQLLNAKNMISYCREKLEYLNKIDISMHDIEKDEDYYKLCQAMDKESIKKKFEDDPARAKEFLEKMINGIKKDQDRLEALQKSRDIHKEIKKFLQHEVFISILKNLDECDKEDSKKFHEEGKKIISAFQQPPHNCKLSLCFFDKAGDQEKRTDFELVSKQHLLYPAIYLNGNLYLPGCRLENMEEKP